MRGIGPIEFLFLVAPLAVVPLALRLAARPGETSWWLGMGRRLQPWAALGVVASFLAGRRGPAAAALALGWVLVTLLVAAHGAAHLGRARRGMAEIAVACGCLMLPVGGGWLLLSRLGVTVMGFEEPIPLLTAVHFHYAALATLVLVGMAGRFAGEGPAYRAIAGGAVAGPPLLAAGITLSPLLEIAAASLVVASVSGLAVFTLARVVPRLRGPARWLLGTSSLSVLAGMALALAYAIGEFTSVATVSLATMARIHGPLNALGFALAGLLGWTLAAPRNLGRPSL